MLSLMSLFFLMCAFACFFLVLGVLRVFFGLGMIVFKIVFALAGLILFPFAVLALIIGGLLSPVLIVLAGMALLLVLGLKLVF